jgi:predicted enzyme related to lactoylglutathione lyase
MTATLTYTIGQFVWRELFTKDVEAAKRFYTAMFGWTAEDRPMGPDWSYTIWKLGDKQIGGMMDVANMPAQAQDVPPHWALYVSVPNVDEAAARAIAAGGKVLGECHEIPGVGRFAATQDPQGAILNLFRSASGDPEDVMPGTGEFCWENLSATNATESIAYYEKVVGWGSLPMEGSDGQTTLFTAAFQGKPTPLASVGQAPEGSTAHWGTFVGVESVKKATQKAVELGGKVYIERMEIPGTGAFGLIEDPTGAMIFVFESSAG